jgi:glutamyl-tRNA reductase
MATHSLDWRLALCGTNHKHSTVEEREPLQLSAEEMAEAQALLSSLPGVLESAIVSTCNRIEFYLVSQVAYTPWQTVQTFYRQLHDLDIAPLRPKFFHKSGSEVAAHMFHVAAGIDSMVLGENQIVGQLRDAYHSSCAVKAAGKIIHRLFHQAFRAGKLVRSETEMGKGACSVATAAVSLLEEKLAAYERPRLLFVGANQMIKLAAKNLSPSKHGGLVFANRTAERAVELAKLFGGRSAFLRDLPQLLGESEIIISCTSADRAIITREMIDNYLAAHPGRPLLIVDMAIPRDVEIESDYSDLIEVHDLDSIGRFVKDRQAERKAAIPQAEEIIERKLAEFSYWFDHVIHEPIYNGLQDSFEEVRRQEISKLLKQMPPELGEAIESSSRRLVNRLLKLKVRSASDEQ